MGSTKHIQASPIGFTSKIFFNYFIKITEVLSDVLPFCMPFPKYKEFGIKVKFFC
jgi:hypothetical protein